MKIIAILLVPVLCFETPRLCLFCKHSIIDKKSKCSLFPKLEESSPDISIKHNEPIDYFYCSTARNINHMCGKDGKRFES